MEHIPYPMCADVWSTYPSIVGQHKKKRDRKKKRTACLWTDIWGLGIYYSHTSAGVFDQLSTALPLIMAHWSRDGCCLFKFELDLDSCSKDAAFDFYSWAHVLAINWKRVGKALSLSLNHTSKARRGQISTARSGGRVQISVHLLDIKITHGLGNKTWIIANARSMHASSATLQL